MNEEDLEIYTWNETFNDDFNDETFGGGLSSNDNLPSFFTTKPTSNNTYNNKPKKSSSKNPSFRDLWNNDSAMPKAPFVSSSNDWDSPSLAPTQSTYSIFDSIKAPLDESNPLFSLDYQQPQQQFQNDQPKALTLEEVEASLMSTHISEKPSNNQLNQQFQDLNQQLVNSNDNVSNDDQQQILFNQQSQQPLFPPLPSQQTHQEISLQAQAMEKIIRDQEIADLKRRRKATKISSMSNFNHIMTPSDKSYILRMQLSALATADPYTEDFYAQIYSTLMRRQQGVLNVGGMAVSVAGGAGRTGMGAGAAKKMRDQIDKIVRAKREKQEEKSSEDPLVGALGKTSTRINARTPRQVLQVSNESSGQAAQDVLSSLPAGASVGPQPALSKRQCMLQIEKLYDLVLQLEHLRRNQPQQIINNNEINADHEDWLNQYNSIAQDVWNGLHVMEPLELSDPHPFISLLSIPKATKLIPRAVRHFNPQQILTLNTLIIACFGQFLTFCDDSRLVESFLACVVPPFMTMVASGSLRLIAGMLALFVERNNIVSVAQSKPGIAFLTILLSKAELLKQIPAGNVDPANQAPDSEVISQWDQIFSLFFSKLIVHLPSLFPSTRQKTAKAFSMGLLGQSNSIEETLALDAEDESVWRFLAAIAINSDNIQQSTLVTEVRDKVQENVISAQQGWVPSQSGAKKVANVNVFLHALGLDASQLVQ